MTSFTNAPTPSASVAAQPEGSRHERQAFTESPKRRELQEEAVLLNLALADGIAARYAGRGVDWDDLAQIGRLGLLKAVVGYRPSERAGFAAYANPTIAGEITGYFRNHRWMIRPPRRVQELHGHLRLVEPDLQQRLQRAPSAHELGVAADELSDAMVAAGAYTPPSLDVPTHADEGLSLGDALPDDGDPTTVVEHADWLRPALASLTHRERQIIGMRFGDGFSQEQIGPQPGLSQMQVPVIIRVSTKEAR